MIPAIVLLGLVNGSRTMMPMAVLCWFAYTGHLQLEGTWGFWAGKLASAIIFSVMAAGELIGDKLPRTPNRTDLFPLAARTIFGGVVGALVATSAHATLLPAVLAGAIAALVGTFLGFHARRWLTRERGLPDLPVALLEDAIVIGVSVFALHLVG